MGELEDETGERLFVEVQRRGCLAHRLRRDGIAGSVMDDQIAEADRRGVTGRIRCMVALDRRADRTRKAPAADENGTDEGVVDPEVAALAAGPLVGNFAAAVAEVRVAV